VQYRVTGATGWSVAATGVTSAAYTVTGLTASTSYDFEVFAVNVAGSGTASSIASATTTIAPPGVPAGLTAGAATGTTVPLSWTAPASGGPVASYSVRSSPHNANTWSTVANISGTSTTIGGLTASTSYDFQVEAVNAVGNSGWTATVTAATTAGGNYLLTVGFLPVAGSTWQTSQGGIGANVNDNSAAIDGSHTIPASVVFALSLSNSVVPVDSGHGAADLETASQFSNGGHNYWAAYMNAPATAGNYYLWAIAKNSGANVVATFCFPSAYTVHT
jgi:hypothetical protein